MAWGLAGNDDSRRPYASVEGLMLLARGDLNSVAWMKNETLIFDFEGELSFEDIEELARADVGVANLGGSRRDELFDDAEFGCFDEVPAGAVGAVRTSPLVVFGGFYVGDLRRHMTTLFHGQRISQSAISRETLLNRWDDWIYAGWFQKRNSRWGAGVYSPPFWIRS